MKQFDTSELYETYSQKIHLFLSRFVGQNEAEDLTQEVFIKVFNSINTFKGNSQISTWIYKIATNTAMDKLKSAGYRKQESRTSSMDFVEPLKTGKSQETECDIEYNLIKTEMNHCIADYINKLPDNYRAIFLLREYDNLTVEEISEITDLTIENVKMRLHRARKKLHEILMAGCSIYYDEYSRLSCNKK